MKNVFTKSILFCCLSLLLSSNAIRAEHISNEEFCFNGDFPEAQMNFGGMCLTAPVLFCPPTYLGCIGDNIDTSVTGVPMALPGEDACPDPVVSFTDILAVDESCRQIIHRMWTATYPPGSASIKLISSCQQTIYLEDTQAPTLTNCPANITIDLSAQCDSTAVWSNPNVDDDCTIASFTVSHSNGSAFPSGNTTVTYTATDDCGRSSQCSFVVSVVGSCCTEPNITCPNDAQVCPVSGDISPDNLGYATAMASNASCGEPVITYSDAIISSGPCTEQREIVRTWTATEPTDNTYSSTCTQNISVADNQNPIILNVPADITINGSGANCALPVNWIVPTASDNCDIASFTSNYSSGASFSEGTTTVVYTAIDNCGNSISSSFTVTINCLCNTNPVITCPDDYLACPDGAYPDPSVTGSAIAVAGDTNCATPNLTYTDIVLSSGPCVGGNDLTRTWIATDPNNPGLQVSCDQRITLQDDGPPTITNIPTDITLFKKGTHCSMPVTWAEPTITDDCGVASVTTSHPNGGDFDGGTTTVTYSVTDACGYLTTASFNITIECNTCNTAPTLSCPADYQVCVGGTIPLPIESGEATATAAGGTCGLPIVYYTDGIGGFGNCAGAITINRTWIAFDTYNPNLTTSCVQVIDINDSAAPVITNIPTDITLNGSGNSCQVPAIWTEPTVTDDCGVQSLESSVLSGSLFSDGSTTVTYTATDNCGNISTASFVVAVICEACTNDPIITCPSDYYGCPNTSVDPSVTGSASASNPDVDCATPVVTYNDTNINAPACAGAQSLQRIWTASDLNNSALAASCIQYIYLSDDTPPVISNTPQNITVSGQGSGCQVAVTWSAPTVSDNCGASLSSNYTSGQTFGEGTTTVTYTATDGCGNTVSTSFTITVTCANCDTPPSITCPGHYMNCPGSSYDPAVTGYPTATNGGVNCNNSPIITYSDQTTTNNNCAGSMNIIRTWTATNPNNNSLTSSCMQYVNVVDNQAPTIRNVPDNITINGTGSDCLIPVTWSEPYATDNCGVQSLSGNLASGSYFSEGTSTIIYTATDNCGNITTESFTVTLICTPTCTSNPNLTCPTNYWACPDNGAIPSPSVTGTASASAGSQYCAAPLLTYNDVIVSSGPCALAKIVERTWTATDPNNSSLTTSCVQNISLEDNTPPTFTFIPQDITVNGTGAGCALVGTWSPCLAVDDCGTVSFTYSHPSGSVFGEGTTTVSCTATDNCGNANTATFNITVVCAATCTSVPNLTCPTDYWACPDSGVIPSPSISGAAITSAGGANCANPLLTYNDVIVSSGPCTYAKIVQRTWTATDPSNGSLTTSCVQNINLEDNTPPTFTFIPQDVTVNGKGTGCAVVANWSPCLAIDDCGTVSLSYSHPSGSVFGESTTTVSVTATDNCGNVSTATFNITVVCAAACVTAPNLSCPTDYWACPVDGTIPTPVVSGSAVATPGDANCASPLVSYNDVIVSSGPCANAKIVQRTWTATDSGNSSLTTSCVQNINLEDNTPPTFTFVPQDITVQGKGSGCSVVGNWSPCLAIDDCGTVSLTYSHASGTVFLEGTTTVSVTATDNCGNVSTATFNITVICSATCTTPPTVSCPPNYTTCPSATTPTPSVSGTANGYAAGGVCSDPVVSYNDIVLSNGPCADARVIERTWTATDPNNTALYATCVQTISLEDTQAPVFSSCPNDIFLNGTPQTGSGSGCYAVANWAVPIVNDNCSVTSVVATDQTGTVVTSGMSFPQGTSVITYTATDGCGNTSTCTFDVNVDCNPVNTIVCPNDIVVQCGGTNGCKVVNWSSPTYSGACGSCQGSDIPGFMYMGELNGHEYYCSLDPATWASANKTCEENGGYLACINSEEENQLLANLLTIQSAWIGLGDPDGDGQFTWGCGDALSFTNWYPGQPNNYNGDQDCVEMLNNGQWNDQYPHYLLEFIMEKPCSFIQQVGGPTSGSCLSGGEYLITYETNDACGPVETCSFRVTVEDALSMTCPEDIVVAAPSNSTGVVVDWEEPIVSSCCTNCPSAGGAISGFVYMGSFNGHHYYCSNGVDTWANAQANCVANGGHLAVINSAAENTFLANILTLQSAWIGANDLVTEGTFQWVNGDSFSYTNWYPGQPNNYNYNQHCVEMLNNGQWNDQYGHYNLEYIMEIESCLTLTQIGGPASGSLLPPGSNHTITYQAEDGCGNVETCSFDVTVESSNVSQTPCFSEGSAFTKFWIERCLIGDIDNTSGMNGGYGDFRDQCATFTAGETFNIQLYPGIASTPIEKVFWTIFIDMNHDGDFDDAGEFSAYGCGTTVMNGMLTVPDNVLNGETVIRIIVSPDDYQTDPCVSYPVGETEDYCIVFNGGTPFTDYESEDSFTNQSVENRSNRTEAIQLQTVTENKYGLRVYPNPVSEVMTIEIIDLPNIVSLELNTIDGKMIKQIDPQTLKDVNRVPVAEIESGFYVLNARYINGHIESQKVIIQK